MPVQEQAVIEGWKGILVTCGLGTPLQRATCAFLTTGAIAYAIKFPRDAFRPDGTMRPSTMSSRAADATDRHYLLTPLTVATAVFLFT
jgi:hypothetical protein